MLYEAERQIAASTAMHIRNGHRLEAKTNEVLRGGEVIEAEAKDAAPRKPRIRWPWKKHPQAESGQPAIAQPPIDPALAQFQGRTARPDPWQERPQARRGTAGDLLG